MLQCAKRSSHLFVLITFAFAAQIAGQVENYETPGNIESKFDLGCVGANELSSKYTPADLYKAVAKCLEQDKLQEGIFLFALAGVYGRFDTLRVADETAHSAPTVLLMQALGAFDESKQNAFSNGLKNMLGNPEGLRAVCKEIVRIGPPNYHPRYMVQHGMKAFIGTGSGDGLVADFSAEAAWKTSLDTYLHCPSLAQQSPAEYEAVLRQFVEHAKAGNVEAMLNLTNAATRKTMGDESLLELYREDTTHLFSRYNRMDAGGEPQPIRDDDGSE